MSLIPFPDVPQVPGVPNIPRAAIGVGVITGVVQQIQKYDQLGLLNKFLGNPWSIVDQNGQPVILPDSVVSFSVKGEQKIATHPVELGSFNAYNKVATPFDLQLVMTCNGQGSMSRDAFLTQIKSMQASLDLYNIITPDDTYRNYNLVRFDYRREASSGVSLITVSAAFMEVRTTAINVPIAKLPAGQYPVKLGMVNVNVPSPQQLASLAQRAIA